MRCTISQVYFGIELYMFQTGLLSIIRNLELYTQQYVFVIQVMLSASEMRISLADSQHNLYDIYLLLWI